MAHKKVKFQTLQRFDLKDAEVLQSGVDDKLGAALKALDPWGTSTFRNGGPVNKITVQGVSNGVVTFGPMKVITAEADNIIELTQDDVNNGLSQIDISSLHNSYITQANQGLSVNGIHFYAYPLIEDTDVEQREFFSVIDNRQETRTVVTRTRSRLTLFALINNSSYSVADSNGKLPIYLGHVKASNISLTNTNSPFNPTSFLSSNYFDSLYGQGEDWDDTGLPNAGERSDFPGTDNLSTGNTYSGLSLILKRIERQLNRIVSYGSADTDQTLVLPLNSKPQFSLQGLNQKLVSLLGTADSERQALDNKHSVAQATYFYNQSSGIFNWSFSVDNDRNDFDIGLEHDYFYAQARGETLNRSITLFNNIFAQQETLSTLVITLPESLAGKKIVRVDVIPVCATGDTTSIEKTDLNAVRFSKTGDSSTYENFNLVKEEQWLDVQGNSKTGQAIMIRMLPFTKFANTNGDVRFGINISVTIDTRS